MQQNSLDEAKAANFPAGTPDFVATSVLETMSPAAAVLEPSDDFRALTGSAPRTFAQWAAQNAQVLA